MHKHLKFSLFAPLALAGLAAAQAGEKPKLPDVTPDDGGRDEMIELFKKVEKRLAEIDRLLYDASAGEAGLGKLEESGIGELLKNTSGKSQEVVRDIDRILEIASKNGGT